ncbi:hypothetical protein Gohar_003692, partial [Gossypium harknessii]|nr:hypothetical protein [Gossypium harknessii]
EQLSSKDNHLLVFQEIFSERCFTWYRFTKVEAEKTLKYGRVLGLPSPLRCSKELGLNTNKGNNIFFNPLSFGNTNTNIVNPSFTIVGTTPTILGAFIGVASTSSMIASENTSQATIPTRVATKPYLKDYTNPKVKQFNGKTSDACEHVMKFLETLEVARLDDDLKLK